ncbi:MAG TPA: hypothetical protein VG148_08720 [Pyrinomonadaceae bacterium]|nr:hypothetical protein [Pyrinomonadaceae bacterium]
MVRRTLAVMLVVLCCAASLALAPPGGAQRGGRQTITGTVVSMSGRAASRSRPFSLIIKDYTSPSDVQTLNDALRKGEDELLHALDKLEAGRIAIGNNVGVTANAVIRTPQAEGGTKITVLFRRWLGMFELRYGTRSSDYRFGYAEIILDDRGRGEGMFIPAARVRLRDGNTWEVEDFGTFPARLLGVRSTGTVPAR